LSLVFVDLNREL